MKKSLCAILILLIALLYGCSNVNISETPESEQPTIESQTTETLQDQSLVLPTAEINTDLLSDIGLTYSQIREKRGKLIEAGTAQGGIYYVFENGYGQYFWNMELLDWGRELATGEAFPIPRDEEGNIIPESAPLPKEGTVCNYMDYVVVSSLFSGTALPVKLSALKKFFGIGAEVASSGEIFDNFYWTTILFDDITISLGTRKEGIVDSDSYAQIQSIN